MSNLNERKKKKQEEAEKKRLEQQSQSPTPPVEPKQEPEQAQEPERVTSVNQTETLIPKSLKLSENDIKELDKWLYNLSGQRNKRITSAKLFRALIFMRDSINNKKLIEALKEIG